ncbi:hypothetical protein ACLKA7_013247 [Drosophila subpalustris]
MRIAEPRAARVGRILSRKYYVYLVTYHATCSLFSDELLKLLLPLWDGRKHDLNFWFNKWLKNCNYR